LLEHASFTAAGYYPSATRTANEMKYCDRQFGDRILLQAQFWGANGITCLYRPNGRT
jgi:hypothetical protein